MDNLDTFTNDNIPKYREEREYGRKGCLAVDDHERDMVYLESVREVPYACPPMVGMGYDDNLVPAIDKLTGKLVDVAFNPARLREKEVADHGDIVRHRDGSQGSPPCRCMPGPDGALRTWAAMLGRSQ